MTTATKMRSREPKSALARPPSAPGCGAVEQGGDKDRSEPYEPKRSGQSGKAEGNDVESLARSSTRVDFTKIHLAPCLARRSSRSLASSSTRNVITNRINPRAIRAER